MEIIKARIKNTEIYMYHINFAKFYTLYFINSSYDVCLLWLEMIMIYRHKKIYKTISRVYA